MIDVAQISEPTAWTPTDDSGAGLTWAVTDARYVRTGHFCAVSAAITWPRTDDASPARIGGLPCLAQGIGGGGAASSDTGITGPVFLATQPDGGNFTLQGADGGTFTNAALSGATIRFTFMYISGADPVTRASRGCAHEGVAQ